MIQRSLTLTSLICSLVALALSACSTVDRTQLLANLAGCERHYDGTVSAGLTPGFSGTIKVDCEPAGAAAPQTERPQPTSITPAN